MRGVKSKFRKEVYEKNAAITRIMFRVYLDAIGVYNVLRENYNDPTFMTLYGVPQAVIAPYVTAIEDRSSADKNDELTCTLPNSNAFCLSGLPNSVIAEYHCYFDVERKGEELWPSQWNPSWKTIHILERKGHMINKRGFFIVFSWDLSQFWMIPFNKVDRSMLIESPNWRENKDEYVFDVPVKYATLVIL